MCLNIFFVAHSAATFQKTLTVTFEQFDRLHESKFSLSAWAFAEYPIASLDCFEARRRLFC
jgi:hypothetical protein